MGITNNSSTPSRNGRAEHLVLDEKWAASSTFEQEFRERFEQIEEYRKQTLTRTASDLFLMKPEGPLNNLISDLLRWYVGRIQGEQTDVGYVPYRLLSDSIAAGPVRVEDVYRVITDNPAISLYRVNGVVIKQLADTIAARGGGAVSGLRMRIVDGRARDVLVGSESIRHDRTYRLAAPSTLFCESGGELHLTTYDEWPVTIVGVPVGVKRVVPEIYSKNPLTSGLRDIVIEYLDNQTVVDRMLDQRLR